MDGLECGVEDERMRRLDWLRGWAAASWGASG